MSLKASLHVHVHGDPLDPVRYTGFQLLDRAKMLNFEVIAFTCHDRVMITPELQAHADRLDIVLIPGIEVNLGGHVLILNADSEAENLKTLEDLREYRKKRPTIFTIAAHPFFPVRRLCLQERIYDQMDLFDGIEHSWCYSNEMNYNKKAEELANQYDLPYIATSDVHHLEMLENDHILIDAEKNMKSILDALRKKQFESARKNKSLFRVGWTFAKMQVALRGKYLPWERSYCPVKPKHEILPPKNQSQSATKPKTDRTS